MIGSFLLGLAAFVIFLVALRAFVKADPKKLAARLHLAGGVFFLAVAAVLMARGLIVLAVPLAVFGLGLLGARLGVFPGSPFPGRKTPGQKSGVRTAFIEMELDHDTGRMDGLCLAGKFEGRRLSALSRTELVEFLQALEDSDGQSAALLEAYLDHREPGWRKAQAAGAEQRTRPTPARMSAEEAYAVLGLRAGATAEEIRQAHRRLMMKLHPDQGGSTYLAARINEAKEVLLGRR